MTKLSEKVKTFKEATRALRDAQEHLRLKRAEYNKAQSDLINDEV